MCWFTLDFSSIIWLWNASSSSIRRAFTDASSVDLLSDICFIFIKALSRILISNVVFILEFYVYRRSENQSLSADLVLSCACTSILIHCFFHLFCCFSVSFVLMFLCSVFCFFPVPFVSQLFFFCLFVLFVLLFFGSIFLLFFLFR